MNDPLIARFAEACGATSPLQLRVDLAGGGLLAEGSVNQPFTLVGRDDSCDVTLSDPDINLRHAWVQVICGRVYIVDLGSRTGVTWPGGVRGSGWLDIGTSAKLGPFLVQLQSPITTNPSPFVANYNPLVADANAKTVSTVALEFRNGKRAKDRWFVNRLLTLVGRASDCKIHLTADDISPYHCGLVSTRTGLWVVDLSGRGIVVNGERMRVAPLTHGTELWVGRFLISCQYNATQPASGTLTRVAPPQSTSASGRLVAAQTPTTKTPPPKKQHVPEDEVQLGGLFDSGEELPSSHILADAFRLWSGPNAAGPMSNPILVSSSGSPSGAHANPASGTRLNALEETHETPQQERNPLIQRLDALYSRLTPEFRQWIGLVSQSLARLPREHFAVVQQELTRVEELTTQIAAVQAEISRICKEPHRETWVAPSSRTPLPDVPLTRTVESQLPRFFDKLRTLENERTTRWHAILALVCNA